MPRLSLFVLALTLVACEADPAPDAAPSPDAPAETASAPEVATPTSTVIVDYEGRLQDGTVFDEGERTPMVLPQMIAGFQRELAGMRAGETKTFDLPPEEAYGATGIPGVIPPNATLTFEVTVHEIVR